MHSACYTDEPNDYFLHLFWGLFFFFCSYCGGTKSAIVSAEVNRCSRKRGLQALIRSVQADKVQSEGPPAGAAVTVLVEEVVVDFDLGAGSEVVWQQHDGHGHLAQVVNLRMIKRIDA